MGVTRSSCTLLGLPRAIFRLRPMSLSCSNFAFTAAYSACRSWGVISVYFFIMLFLLRSCVPGISCEPYYTTCTKNATAICEYRRKSCPGSRRGSLAKRIVLQSHYLVNTVSPLKVSLQTLPGSMGSSNRVQIMQLSSAWSAVKLQSQGIGLPSASNTLNAPRMPVVEST